MIALTLARKPPADAVGRNASRHGTGALNIGACRIGFTSEADKWKPATGGPVYKGYMDGSGQPYQAEHHKPTLLITAPDARGRWPANLLLSSAGASALDERSGMQRSGSGSYNANHTGLEKFGKGIYTGGLVDSGTRIGYADEGGASRFFKVFK